MNKGIWMLKFKKIDASWFPELVDFIHILVSLYLSLGGSLYLEICLFHWFVYFIGLFPFLFLPSHLEIITINKETLLEDSLTVLREERRAEGHGHVEQDQSLWVGSPPLHSPVTSLLCALPPAPVAWRPPKESQFCLHSSMNQLAFLGVVLLDTVVWSDFHWERSCKRPGIFNGFTHVECT